MLAPSDPERRGACTEPQSGRSVEKSHNSNIIPVELVENKIFLIREQKVMLGHHLAELYGVETRILMQAVKRNIDRFPSDFMLKLSREEIMRISQIVISLKYSKVVYAFTEQGVAMLSGILNSKRAVAVNIAIMRTFVKLRKILIANKEFAEKLNQLEHKISIMDKNIIVIFEAIRQFTTEEEKPKNRIGFI